MISAMVFMVNMMINDDINDDIVGRMMMKMEIYTFGLINLLGRY